MTSFEFWRVALFGAVVGLLGGWSVDFLSLRMPNTQHPTPPRVLTPKRMPGKLWMVRVALSSFAPAPGCVGSGLRDRRRRPSTIKSTINVCASNRELNTTFTGRSLEWDRLSIMAQGLITSRRLGGTESLRESKDSLRKE